MDEFVDHLPVSSIRCTKILKKRLDNLDFARKGLTYEKIIDNLIIFYEERNKIGG